MTNVDHRTDTTAPAFHEVTVIAGSAGGAAGRRRRRLGSVAESRDPAVSVSAVAHRHGLKPNQLFTWRRRFQEEADRRILTTLAALSATVASVAKKCSASARPVTSLSPASRR